MDNQEEQVQLPSKKKKILITLLGWFFVLAGLVTTIAIVDIINLLKTYDLQIVPLNIKVFVYLAIIGVFIFPILYIISGIGFLKLKRWLPKFFITVVIVGFIFQINNYIAFPFKWNIETTLLKDLGTFVIYIAVIFYIQKKKELFKN